MVGTILLDDLQSSVEDQLHQHVTDLLGQAQQAASAVVQPVQALGAGVAQAVQAPLIAAPSQQEVLGTLQQHVDNLTQAAQQPVQTAQAVQQALQAHVDSLTQAPQQALQVLGQPNQPGGALTQLGQTKDQVLGALNQHVDNLSQVVQQVPQGLQSLATPPPPSPQAPPSTQPAALGGDQGLGSTTGPLNQPATTTAPASDRSMSYQDYARAAAQRAGIDPNIFAAQIQQESGFDPKAKSPAGAIGIAQFMPGTAAGMNVDPTDPYAALDAAAQMDAQNLKKYDGDYAKTLAAYNAGGGAVDQYGGVPPYKETQSYVSTILDNAKNAVGSAASALGTAANNVVSPHAPSLPRQSEPGQTMLQTGTPDSDGRIFPLPSLPDNAPTATYHSQGGSDLMAPRGTPVAAMQGGKVVEVFQDKGDHQFGGNAVLVHGSDGLDYYYAHFDQPTYLKQGDTVQAGQQIGQVGNSGNAFKGGQGETHLHIGIGYGISDGVGSEGGLGENYNAQALLTRLENGVAPKGTPPVTTAGGAQTPAALGGAGSGQQTTAPVTLGGPSVQPVQYVHGTLQDAQGNTVADNGPTLIQSAQDVLGGAAGAVGGAVGGAASALGTAAQGALGTAQEINRIQPGTEALKAVTPVLGQAQQSASSAVNQVASDVQQAAQGVLGAAQDVNRLTPGTTAVNAAAPVLGAAASDVGAGAQQATQTLGGAASAAGSTVRQTADELGAQRDAFAQSPIGQRLMQAAIENAQAGPSLLPAGSVSLYQDIMQAKNDWLAQNNPLNNLPGAKPEPGHEQDLSAGGLIAGLTTGIAQQFTDPVMLSLLGPTSSLANVGKEAVAGIVGPRLADNLAPGAAKVLMAVAEKFTSGAIVGGLQNAMFEAEKKEATPESVGMALVTGAGLGGVIDVGVGGVLPVVRRLGQVLIDQAPTIRTALSARQAGQADVNAALGGVPAAVVRARGEAPAEVPGVGGGTPPPEAGFRIPVAAGRAATEPATPVDRMYHGTGTGFETPAGEHFDPNGLYGPGYYLTSDARVAGGVVTDTGRIREPGYAQSSSPQLMRLTELQDTADELRSLLDGTHPMSGDARQVAYARRELPVVEADIARHQTYPAIAGGNVRAVDVPQNLRLLNADATVAPADIAQVGDAIARRTGDTNDARSFVINVRSQNPRGISGEGLQTAVRNYLDVAQPELAVTERPQAVNAVLANAGFDGITYAGGKRVPMADAQGAPIEHQATVIFPESLDKIRNAISGRQGGQAKLPFTLNAGGAVAGGVAGNVATPENATPEERARNIALGAGAGLLGTSALTRALERRRLPAEAGGGVRPPETGFRAPVTPDDLNVRSISQAEARQLVGPAYDPSTRTTTRPPEEGEPGEPTGIPGVTRRTVQGAEPLAAPAGTNLSDVHSNPHLLNEAGPGETPMTMDERRAHQDTLEQRYQANQDRLAAVDEQLRNPNAKPERPPWGAGWTNDQLVSIAKAHGQSAYEPLWWEKAGLESGSGEVRENVGEGGFRNPNATREPTPQELRAERNQLAVDQRDLEAAGEQQATAPDNARFLRRQQSAAGLPFAGGEESAPHGPYATEQASSGPGSLAEDIVTQNGRKSYGDPLSGDGLREAPGEVVGTKGGITGTGISDIEAEAVRPGPPSEATLRRMPNLDAMLKGEMPEVRAQIQRAAEDNQQLFDAYTQGRISHDSLVTDLATKVGMTREQWLKTPVGKGFNQDEMVALQAAAIDAQARSSQMAKDIAARGGVDALSPEQVAYGLNELIDNTRLLTVARGGRSTAGRTLNALKIRLDATMARGINASNERIGATRLANQAKAAVKRATQQLEQNRQLEVEKNGVVSRLRKGEFDAGPAATPPTTEAEQVAARERGYENIPEERRGPVGPGTPTEMPGTPAPRAKPPSNDLINKIADAYDQLDRYNAMTLHEKADVQAKLQAERDALAAKRKAVVRGAPEELLSALQAELKWEQNNFAKRKDTWETMAFWDSKANENVAQKRNAFRGGLYIEQYRKSADLAAKSAEADAKRAFDLESKRQSIQSQKATTLLEAVGGAKPSRELLSAYVEAVTSDDPLAAGKFVKGLMTPGWWARAQTLRIAGLLSSTVTHMANMVGNVTQVPLEVATHAVTVPIDWARAKATGGQRVAYMAELGPMLQSYGPGFAASMGDAVKILQSGISPADAVKLENIRPGIASGSGAVDAVLEGPLRALQAEDELFRGGAFAMQANRVATRYAYREGFRGEQLAGRTANIIKNLETYPDLYKEAHDAMLRMVFQEHRDWIPSPKGPVRGVVSQPLPFIKTPANITAQGMGLSPFGVAGSIAAVRARGVLEASGKATGAQLDRATLLAEQRIARTAIGTAIFGMGVGMGAGTFSGGKSLLTGAYDPNEASTYPQGWREWSMVTQDPVSGNTYYVPLQNFGAAGAPLAMAAIVTDAAKRGHSLLDENEAQRAATSIGQYVLDNTFLQGLSDTVNVLHDPSRYANKFLESLVSSYGPFSALGRQVQRAYGVASRNPHDGLMGLVEAMESNYPGLSGNVPESLTAIGEPRTQGISGAAAFALPVRADILRDEPTLRALRDNDVRIPPAPKAVNVGNGWSVDLTPEEQDQLQRARGVAIRDWVARMQAMPAYQAAPAGEAGLGTRNLFLAKAVSNASQQADIDFYRSLPRSDIRAQSDGGRAVRRTVPTTYTVAGEEPAA